MKNNFATDNPGKQQGSLQHLINIAGMGLLIFLVNAVIFVLLYLLLSNFM